jgi:hypothetical protein
LRLISPVSLRISHSDEAAAEGIQAPIDLAAALLNEAAGLGRNRAALGPESPDEKEP